MKEYLMYYIITGRGKYGRKRGRRRWRKRNDLNEEYEDVGRTAGGIEFQMKITRIGMDLSKLADEWEGRCQKDETCWDGVE